MKYSELKTYQSVKFEQGQETHFSLTKPRSVEKQKNLKMEDAGWGIRVTTDTDEAIISYNNVAWAKELKPSESAERKEHVQRAAKEVVKEQSSALKKLAGN